MRAGLWRCLTGRRYIGPCLTAAVTESRACAASERCRFRATRVFENSRKGGRQSEPPQIWIVFSGTLASKERARSMAIGGSSSCGMLRLLSRSVSVHPDRLRVFGNRLDAAETAARRCRLWIKVARCRAIGNGHVSLFPALPFVLLRVFGNATVGSCPHCQIDGRISARKEDV